MKFDPEETLKELLKNRDVKEVVSKHKLSHAQQVLAIPVLIDIKNESKQKSKLTFFSDLEVTESGSVEKVSVINKKHPSYFLKNVKTQWINEASFSNDELFYKTEERKVLVNKLAEYVLGVKPKKGVYIFGQMGVGKTFLTKRIMRKMAENDKEVGFVNTSQLTVSLKTSFANNEKYFKIFQTLKIVDHLFIDDIGSETIQPWFRDDFLFPVLNYRSENKKSTFFTSNYSLAQLEKTEGKTHGSNRLDHHKGKRLVDRVASLAKPFELKGINYRREKA